MQMKTIGIAMVGVMALVSTASADDKGKDKDKAPAMSDAELMKLAAKAAPPEVTKGATYVTMGMDMKARQLKAGTNGWMCMAAMMGPKPEVMCLDKEWQGWADAWMNKKDPKVTGIGVAYMLAGDNGASNTDPYAMGPTADNNWVVSPPHMMILTPDLKTLDALPTDPTTGGPWVMWKGTKYAHIMVPVQPMPKQPAPPKAK
jgi:hypothetical protein